MTSITGVLSWAISVQIEQIEENDRQLKKLTQQVVVLEERVNTLRKNRERELSAVWQRISKISDHSTKQGLEVGK